MRHDESQQVKASQSLWQAFIVTREPTKVSHLSELEYLPKRVLGYTEASIANNSRNLDNLRKLSGKCIWEVTTHDIDRFYEQLVGRGLAYSTRRKYQSAITTFLDYLRSRHAHDIWQVYRVAVPSVLDKFNRHTHRLDDREDAATPPQPEVLERFWHRIKEELVTARKFAPIARDYALYRLLALAGLRINEAVMLDVKDCHFDLGEQSKVHVRFGKGSRGSGYKSRWIPMLVPLPPFCIVTVFQPSLLRWAHVETTDEKGQPQSFYQDVPNVSVVDTTAAGDCIVGALTVALIEGPLPAEALRFAVTASSLKVTTFGAQSGFCTQEEVLSAIPYTPI